LAAQAAQVLPSLAQAAHSVLAHSPPLQAPQQEDLDAEQDAKAKATPADMRIRNFFIIWVSSVRAVALPNIPSKCKKVQFF
jgi:hypothetical protein